MVDRIDWGQGDSKDTIGVYDLPIPVPKEKSREEIINALFPKAKFAKVPRFVLAWDTDNFWCLELIKKDGEPISVKVGEVITDTLIPNQKYSFPSLTQKASKIHDITNIEAIDTWIRENLVPLGIPNTIHIYNPFFSSMWKREEEGDIWIYDENKKEAFKEPMYTLKDFHIFDQLYSRRQYQTLWSKNQVDEIKKKSYIEAQSWIHHFEIITHIAEHYIAYGSQDPVLVDIIRFAYQNKLEVEDMSFQEFFDFLPGQNIVHLHWYISSYINVLLRCSVEEIIDLYDRIDDILDHLKISVNSQQATTIFDIIDSSIIKLEMQEFENELKELWICVHWISTKEIFQSSKRTWTNEEDIKDELGIDKDIFNEFWEWLRLEESEDKIIEYLYKHQDTILRMSEKQITEINKELLDLEDHPFYIEKHNKKILIKALLVIPEKISPGDDFFLSKTFGEWITEKYILTHKGDKLNKITTNKELRGYAEYIIHINNWTYEKESSVISSNIDGCTDGERAIWQLLANSGYATKTEEVDILWYPLYKMRTPNTYTKNN